ncbi:hypothetical protein [Moorena producens]|uniref:hypothetical protein n=1 Tax=Moorena producens TaxID=1155739 RepID=UPI003C70712E
MLIYIAKGKRQERCSAVLGVSPTRALHQDGKRQEGKDIRSFIHSLLGSEDGGILAGSSNINN